jgi:GNAT superfamily N-acetyltransferase
MGTRYGLTIRAATAADAPGLATLLAACGLPIPADQVAARLAAMPPATSAVLLADGWGPPSGVVAVHWYSSITASRPVAQISLLLVGLEDRRRGVGRLLVKAAARAARAAGCDTLDVLSGSALAPFLAANGFAGDQAVLTRSLRKQS